MAVMVIDERVENFIGEYVSIDDKRNFLFSIYFLGK
jgi:hypothetical protein